MLIKDNPDLDIKLANPSASSSPAHKIESNADGLIVHGIDLNVSEKEVGWHSPVTISHSAEGDNVDYDLDARLSNIHGIYVIKDNAIIKHYYQETQIFFVLLVVILMPVVYLAGKLIIFIINKRNKTAKPTGQANA